MVVGLWALVLLPSWLRTHEQADEGRQVDLFRRAMTQLSGSQMDTVLRSEHKQVEVKRAPRAGSGARRGVSAAERRRRVLVVLAALEVVGIGAWALGAGTVPVVLPLLLIASFLTLARSQVRAERARRAAQRPDLSSPVRRPSMPTASVSVSRTMDAMQGVRRALRDRQRSEHAPVAVDLEPSEQTPAAPMRPSGWQPVHTPAPSYVSAPAATAVPRGIDAAGGWTGTAMVEAARAVQSGSHHTAPTGDHAAAQAMAEQPTDRMPIVTASVADAGDHTAEIPVIRITA